ncbi:MAG: hypothetical protein PHD31_00145 [Candidatus Pacebacteria bacterium]|nr:hypothetical protein [Candidatus Paceibacterota bacterium]
MRRNESQKIILETVGARPIAFNPILAHALGSVKAGLLLSQLLFWHGKGKDEKWTYKTAEEFRKETALSRKEQDGAIKICKKYNLISTKLKGIPAKRYFYLHLENIANLLKNYCSTLSKIDKQDCPKSKNKIVPEEQTITENTT